MVAAIMVLIKNLTLFSVLSHFATPKANVRSLLARLDMKNCCQWARFEIILLTKTIKVRITQYKKNIL